MNWRGLVIGAITLLAGLIVLALLNREQTGENQAKSIFANGSAQQRSDYFMEGVVSRNFDQNGQLSHVLKSPRIDHYQDQQISLMQQPHIQLARPDGTPWEVSAQSAQAEHRSEKLVLRDQVSLTRAGEGGVASLRMDTDKLVVDLSTRIAETAADVRFTSPGGQISGTGLHANLATEQLQLLANVKGHYEQTTP